jgi:hypothetical protein
VSGELDDFLDDDHAAIVNFAETYMDEDEREGFVDQLMERRGYQRVTSWGPGEQPPAPRSGGGSRRGGGNRGGSGSGAGRSRSPYFKR